MDLGVGGSLEKTFAAGKLSLEITNMNLSFVKQLPRGLKFSLPESCPVDVGFPPQVKTISGLKYLARKGVLYFNLHTKSNVFFGEMRGQIYPAAATPASR